jgi:hypothetical protein
MIRSPNDVWPPLIVATGKPRWLWWRDSALTVAMWVLFAAMLESEFGLFFGRYFDEHWGFHFNTKPHWHRFFGLLEPYVWLVIALLGFLAAATVATIHRTRNLLRHAPPPALPTDEEARHALTDPATLEAARAFRKVTVHVQADGTQRFEKRG